MQYIGKVGGEIWVQWQKLALVWRIWRTYRAPKKKGSPSHHSSRRSFVVALAVILWKFVLPCCSYKFTIRAPILKISWVEWHETSGFQESRDANLGRFLKITLHITGSKKRRGFRYAPTTPLFAVRVHVIVMPFYKYWLIRFAPPISFFFNISLVSSMLSNVDSPHFDNKIFSS